MRNPLAKHPPWRQLIIISTVLPMMIVLGVLAFAWPVARLAPRDLPVGIVGTSRATEAAVAGLTSREPGGFDFYLYPDEASARSAIGDRDIYGAFDIGARGITVLEASAASPTVAGLLSTVGQDLAHAAARPAGASGGGQAVIPVRSVDVVPTSAGDPRGLVLGSAVLPLTICAIIMASVIALVLRFRPAWRQVLAVATVSATASLGAYLIAQGFLGALPHEHLASWAALFLTLLAVSAPATGLIALIGPAGLGLSAALMIFIGNPFSGATSAPQLLPSAVGRIGQWLPPRPTPACSAAPPTSTATAAPVTSASSSSGSSSGSRPSSPATMLRSSSPPAGAWILLPRPDPLAAGYDTASADWLIPGPQRTGPAPRTGMHQDHPRHARCAGQQPG